MGAWDELPVSTITSFATKVIDAGWEPAAVDSIIDGFGWTIERRREDRVRARTEVGFAVFTIADGAIGRATLETTTMVKEPEHGDPDLPAFVDGALEHAKAALVPVLGEPDNTKRARSGDVELRWMGPERYAFLGRYISGVHLELAPWEEWREREVR